jgi:hypothetical protein
MSETDHPKIEEKQCGSLQEYVEHIFREAPHPPGSQPLLLESAVSKPTNGSLFGSREQLTEVDIFRTLGQVLTHGITHLYGSGDKNNRAFLQYMTPAHVEHVHKCFQATGYDFLINPSPSNPLIRKCLPSGGPPKCLRTPKNDAKTEFLTFLFHPLEATRATAAAHPSAAHGAE